MADQADSGAKPRSRAAAAEALPGPREAVDEKFPLRAFLENPASLNGIEIHVVAGAAALAGWGDDELLTKTELKEGVDAFLKHQPTDHQEA